MLTNAGLMRDACSVTVALLYLAVLIVLKYLAVKKGKGEDMKKHLWNSVRKVAIAVGASVAAVLPTHN
jgi:hypothetical protein